MKNVVIGTAGHIDHGKSALIEALTGTHPDRLEEERRRGITIDLGFAFLKNSDVSIGFVDVPGHERFVRNMLAGVGGIDCVLLVIAADEGVKPQTREHFEICRLLEIPRGIVALTKSDLVDADTLALVQIEIEDYLRESFLESAPIVPVSARTGAGLENLREELLRVASEVSEKDSSRWFRLPIDRAFAMKGFGTVVTGTLVSGSVAIGDEVELLPAKKRLRVRGIQSGGNSVVRASAGQRTALNLAGVEVADLRRGMTLAAPGQFSATLRADAEIALLATAKKSLSTRSKVHFHQGAAETVAEVILLGPGELKPGESAFAQLVFQEKVFVWPGDRFILRQFSPVVTIGGGRILDAQARRHRGNQEGTVKYLAARQKGDRQEILIALLEEAGRSLTGEELIGKTAWLPAKIAQAAETLKNRGSVRILQMQPLRVALAEHVAENVSELRAAISKFHAENPLAAGIAKETLLASGKRDVAIRQAALEELIAKGEVSVSGDVVKRAGATISLTAEETRVRAQIAGLFEKGGVAPAAPAEILKGVAMAPAQARKLLELLLRERVLVKVSADLFYHASAIARVRGMLGEYKKKNGPRIGVAAFKDLAGITRKHAIPLLEYLDRTGVTQRRGDERDIL
jgi:selenocysteine-specific elongation factor